MMQNKSTNAFRTIGEAGEELDLQPHVLRFWESKFAQIQPMKRSGGRRFYRSEDIEFLRGIKILLHREKHPIKDVQKLIRIKGAQSVIDLGRSKTTAPQKNVKDTNLVPKRIKPVIQTERSPMNAHGGVVQRPAAEVRQVEETVSELANNAPESPTAETVIVSNPVIAETETSQKVDKEQLKQALRKLRSLKQNWEEYK